ncbi:MAG: rRNA maturation RNase YbeY [Pseudomonadota bacterium]
MSKSLHLSVQYARRPRSWPKKDLWYKWMSIALEATSGYVTLRLVDADEATTLNETYRKKSYPTNILSFPYDDIDDSDTIYGDLVVCVPVVEKEIHDQNKSLEEHLAHLVIHGMLHLQGYDHEVEEDAQIMEAKEIFLLNALGYADPYNT